MNAAITGLPTGNNHTLFMELIEIFEVYALIIHHIIQSPERFAPHDRNVFLRYTWHLHLQVLV